MTINIVLIRKINWILAHILELLLGLLILGHLLVLLLLLLVLWLRYPSLNVRFNSVGMLNFTRSTSNLPLIARSPMIRPCLIRRLLIIEALFRGLRLRIFVVHHLNPIKIACPIALRRIGTRSVLPASIMIPLKCVACPLRGSSEVSLITTQSIWHNTIFFTIFILFSVLLLFRR